MLTKNTDKDDSLIKSVLQNCKNSLSEKLYIIESNNINSVLVALKKRKEKEKLFYTRSQETCQYLALAPEPDVFPAQSCGWNVTFAPMEHLCLAESSLSGPELVNRGLERSQYHLLDHGCSPLQ